MVWFIAGLTVGSLFGAACAVSYAAWGELEKLKVMS